MGPNAYCTAAASLTAGGGTALKERHLGVGYACYVCRLDPRNVQSLLHQLYCMLLQESGARTIAAVVGSSIIQVAKCAPG